MIDFSEIFDDPEMAQRVDLLRGQGEYLADGTWSQGYVHDAAIAIVHPTKPDDMQLLPEGERYLPSKKIMSKDVIVIGDLLLYQGTRWRIAQLSDWSEYGYYNGIAVRHDGTAQPAAPALSLPDGSVRPADQAAPTGSNPFVTVKRMNSTSLGPERRDFDGVRETVTSPYLHQISINAYGSNAYELMLKARALLASEQGMAGLRAMGAGLVIVSAPLDLSSIVGAGYESRARIELQITHHHRVVVALPSIEHARIDIHTSAGQTASVEIIPPENP